MGAVDGLAGCTSLGGSGSGAAASGETLEAYDVAGCTAPIFVGLALFALGSGPTGSVVILGSYAAGMAALMIAVTLLSAVGRAGLLRTLSRNTGRISHVAGALLAVAGVAQIYLFVFDFDYLGILRLL